MRVLLAGDWQWAPYESAFADALMQLGHQVTRFSFQTYFTGRLGRVQQALPMPVTALWRLNKGLLKAVRDVHPDIVLLWRPTHILPSTVRKMKRLGALTVSHNHDDPFGPLVNHLAPWHHRFLWIWYHSCLSKTDLTIVNRQLNVPEAKSGGAKNVSVLKPYFVPDIHQPIALSDEDRRRFECDVVFIGHYENDERDKYIEALVDAGLHVRLFGGGYWTRKVLDRYADYFGDVPAVQGIEYSKALCGAQLCLAFLSKMNRDTYTTRCFEIPACGRLLLCQRTADLEAMFIDGEEAVFFTDIEELCTKALWLLAHPQAIARIAAAGRRRVCADHHDVVSRASTLIELAADALQKRQLAESAGAATGLASRT
jgi:hypothetical protein